MSDDKIQCPNPECGRMVPPGSFCELCGQPLGDESLGEQPTGLEDDTVIAQDAAPPASDDTSGNSVRQSRQKPVDDPPPAETAEHEGPETASIKLPFQERPNRPSTPSGDQEERRRGTPQPPPRPSFRGRNEPESEDRDECECDHLKFYIDRSRIFMEDRDTPFYVKLQSLGKRVSNIRVTATVEQWRGEIIRITKKIRHLKKGKSRKFSIDFRPEKMKGRKTFTWEISYRCSGKSFSYDCESVHEISAVDEDAATAIEKLEINISQGHAGDVRIGEVLDYYRNLREEKDLDKNRLGSGSSKAPALWELQPLYEEETDKQRNWVRTLPPQPAPRTDRLSLHMDDRIIHLIAKNRLYLGCQSTCDIVTVIFDEQGTPDRGKCAGISRYHCGLELDGAACSVTDGGVNPRTGRYKQSKFGTFLDSRLVSADSGTPIPMARTVVLSLGADKKENPARFYFSLEAKLCGCNLREAQECPFPDKYCETGAPASLVLSRQDQVPESFVVLWKYCPIHLVDPILKDVRIWHHRGGFLFRTENESGWLAPGREIHLNDGQIIHVREFQQWGRYFQRLKERAAR